MIAKHSSSTVLYLDCVGDSEALAAALDEGQFVFVHLYEREAEADMKILFTTYTVVWPDQSSLKWIGLRVKSFWLDRRMYVRTYTCTG